MPAYEYRCLDCHRKFEVLMSFSEYGTRPVQCKYCQSAKVQRLISKVRFARSEESRLESLADPANLANLDEDPRSLGRMMRQMSGQVGEEMGPEFDEVVHRLESGQSPEQIEKELPDLAEGGAPSADASGLGSLGSLGDD